MLRVVLLNQVLMAVRCLAQDSNGLAQQHQAAQSSKNFHYVRHPGNLRTLSANTTVQPPYQVIPGAGSHGICAVACANISTCVGYNYNWETTDCQLFNNTPLVYECDSVNINYQEVNARLFLLLTAIPIDLICVDQGCTIPGGILLTGIDDQLTLYADGVQVLYIPTATSTVTSTLPVSTRLLAAMGYNTLQQAGIIISLSIGTAFDIFYTSTAWKCTTTYSANWFALGFDDSTWPTAVKQYAEYDLTYHMARGSESAAAIWIWTSSYANDQTVYCRGYPEI